MGYGNISQPVDNAAQYIHRSGVPLAKVDLSAPEDRDQLSFLGECDGMCGV